MTDEQNEELTQKRAELDDVEKRWRIAVETHPDPEERERETSGDSLSSEQTEFAKLEDGVSLAGFLLGRPSGESVEYRQETGLSDSIPWVGFLDGPERIQLRVDAYSEAPASGTAVNVQAIIDRVTAGLHARRLGIQFPRRSSWDRRMAARLVRRHAEECGEWDRRRRHGLDPHAEDCGPEARPGARSLEA